jgi:uncharacterized protein
MTLSMYDVTVPVLIRGLGMLSEYLGSAARFAADNNFDPGVLVNARLAPDMLPLAGQVQRASDTAKASIGRLTDVPVPSFADSEKTLEELADRVARTVDFLKTVRPEHLEGAEKRTIELKFRAFKATFSGDAYVLQFMLPNFYFHLTTAHDILRHNGMKIGKKDYLGSFE